MYFMYHLIQHESTAHSTERLKYVNKKQQPKNNRQFFFFITIQWTFTISESALHQMKQKYSFVTTLAEQTG
jgi:hypothetical protein